MYTVSAGRDGSSQIYWRGGGAYQPMIMVRGLTVNQVHNHLELHVAVF
jgi:hypothetical protein